MFDQIFSRSSRQPGPSKTSSGPVRALVPQDALFEYADAPRAVRREHARSRSSSAGTTSFGNFSIRPARPRRPAVAKEVAPAPKMQPGDKYSKFPVQVFSTPAR